MPDSGSFELNITVGDSTFQASGNADVVMKALSEFKGLLAGTPTVKRQAKKTAADDIGDEGDGGKSIVLPLFIKERNPKGNLLTATAIVAWAQLHGNKPQGVTPAEALALWKTTSMKAPGNLPRDLTSAAKDGLLEKKGRVYTVTGHGKTQLGLPTH